MPNKQPTSLKELSARFWDENPCGSTGSWQNTQELRFKITDPYLVPVLESSLLADRRVLEIGCGQGLDAERIVQRCRSYTGVDMSSASIEIAREMVTAKKPRNVEVSFRVADAECLPFGDASFDAVYSVGVLHHTPDFDRALREVERVLEPGGVLVLMLYRSFTPLWVVLRAVRGALQLPIAGPVMKKRVMQAERSRLTVQDGVGGTAMLELFGCPIINTYTLTGMRRRFSGRFQIREHSLHRVGIDQIVRVLPEPLRDRWPHAMTAQAEASLRRALGFYMLIVAERVGD
jgi:SAM-dependent methyltransferase